MNTLMVHSIIISSLAIGGVLLISIPSMPGTTTCTTPVPKSTGSASVSGMACQFVALRIRLFVIALKLESFSSMLVNKQRGLFFNLRYSKSSIYNPTVQVCDARMLNQGYNAGLITSLFFFYFITEFGAQAYFAFIEDILTVICSFTYFFLSLYRHIYRILTFFTATAIVFSGTITALNK